MQYEVCRVHDPARDKAWMAGPESSLARVEAPSDYAALKATLRLKGWLTWGDAEFVTRLPLGGVPLFGGTPMHWHVVDGVIR